MVSKAQVIWGSAKYTYIMGSGEIFFSSKTYCAGEDFCFKADINYSGPIISLDSTYSLTFRVSNQDFKCLCDPHGESYCCCAGIRTDGVTW